MSNNLIIGIQDHWNSTFGLKDVLHAILLLFYEPDYLRIYDPDVFKILDDMSMEQCVRESLMGGVVARLQYPPNEAWCTWAKNHGILVSGSQTESVSTKVQGRTDEADTSMPVSHHLSSPYLTHGQFTNELGSLESVTSSSLERCPECFFLYRIRLKRITPRVRMKAPWDVYRTYYFGAASTHLNVSGCIHHPVMYAWAEAASRKDVNDAFQISLVEDWYLPDEIMPPLVPNEYVDSYEDKFESTEARGEVDSSLPAPNSTMSLLENGIRESLGQSKCGKWHVSKPDVNLNPVSGINTICIDEFTEYISHESGPNEVPDMHGSDSSSYIWTESELCDCAGMLEDWLGSVKRHLPEDRLSLKQLLPRWWPFYQTRWPPCFSPGQVFVLIPTRDDWLGDDFYRPSSTAMYFNLFEYNHRNPDIGSVVLVDGLALSPITPILNRLVSVRQNPVFQKDKYPHYAWKSVEWMSVSEAFCCRSVWSSERESSLLSRSSLMLAVLCLISNWLGYLSRMELYSHPLGYSRPLTRLALDSVGVSCLTPANLGCGQCSVFDGWPMWLVFRTSRILCHFAWFLSCSRSLWMKNVVGSTCLLFPFADLDEI
ncbi:unnamed protein product [Calicophoron daubneyi]